MSSPLILVTGFEPFQGVARNPSGLIVECLVAEPPRGVRISGGVLPVSIERVPAAFDALLAAAPERPDALLSLGVQKGPWFRLERRARAALSSTKLDNDGRLADGLTLEGAVELATTLDLDALADVLRAAGADDVRTSDDAGGFVCERTYHHGLTWAGVLDVPALFLHVPPLEAVELDAQVRAVAALARELG